MYSRIAGTGKYLPERILTNADLEKMVETTDEWIRSRTGIEYRHIAADDEATSDLAYKAGLAALENAGLAPNDIDLVLVGTTTPDLIFPERRLPRAGKARDQELPGVQSRSGLLGIRVRPRRRGSVHSVGAGAACARHRRRDDVAHHRLDGSRDVRAVRRRRRCGDPRGRRDSPASSIRRWAPTGATASCSTPRAASRRAIASRATLRPCA